MNVAEQKSHNTSYGWKPINTAPKDKFVLLACPSGHTTTPWVFTTGILHSNYKVGRWVDHANDDLSDWGMSPIFWRDDIITLDSATPASAPAVPQGWKLVPVEPTEEMVTAGNKSRFYREDGDIAVYSVLSARTYNTKQAWAAMLAATPSPALAVPQGWRFKRNADDSIGIFAPPPKPGESQRTSHAVYPGQNRDLHELLGKLADQQAATPAPAPAQEPVTLTDAGLLEQFKHHPNWELSTSNDPECDPSAFWLIHEVKGGRNDREWFLIGEGESPRAAIIEALRAKGGK